MKKRFQTPKAITMALVIELILSNITFAGDPNLIGWWQFDENTGVIAKDSSDHPSYGIINNAIRVDGKLAKALKFNDSGNVSIPADALSPLDKEVTITLWQYGDAAIQPHADYIFIAVKENGQRVLSVHLPWSDGSVYWDAGTDNDGYDRIFKSASASEYKGTWNHWAFVKNAQAGYMEIYLNGKLWHSGSSKTKPLGKADAFGIGSTPGGFYNYCGKIDDFRIYNRALNANEIYVIYDYPYSRCNITMASSMQTLAKWLKYTDQMFAEQKYQIAVDFLEEKLFQYSNYYKETPKETLDECHGIPLSVLYSKLAKGKKALGVQKQVITMIYRKVVESGCKGFFPQEQIMAILWLLKNEPEEKHSSIIELFIRNNSIEKSPSILTFFGKVCVDDNKWETFRRFIVLMLSKTSEPVIWAEYIDVGIEEKSTLKEKYFTFCESKSELFEYVFKKKCKLAKDYIATGKSEQAFKIIRDFAIQNNSIKHKAICEFQICKYLFEISYNDALLELNHFISHYKKDIGDIIIRQAVLMKGRCYIQLGEIEKACGEFLTVMVEYPNAKQAPEASFFIGYCYMLQGKFELAKEALNLVVKDYPQSNFASKARLCLARIKSMTEK